MTQKLTLELWSSGPATNLNLSFTLLWEANVALIQTWTKPYLGQVGIQTSIFTHMEGSRSPCATSNQIELGALGEKDSGKSKVDSESSCTVESPPAPLATAWGPVPGTRVSGVRDTAFSRGPPPDLGSVEVSGVWSCREQSDSVLWIRP